MTEHEHRFDQDYWDRIWAGDRAPAMSESPPNPHLVREIAGLAPGTALEAGCGAGAEALWLAEQGWRVTGADVAEAALEVAAARAAARSAGERVRWVHADLSVWVPEGRFDLVTTHYAHPAMPQLDFYERLAGWVAPGGTLLVVGHLHHDQPGSDHGHGHGHGHPPAEASATAAAITARLDAAAWQVVTAEESARTVAGAGGRTTTLHDVVVRARRAPYAGG